MIRHELTGPVRIDPQDKPAFVCGCGLTKSFPLCDGSHKACAKEDGSKLYTYDKAGEKIIDERADD